MPSPNAGPTEIVLEISSRPPGEYGYGYWMRFPGWKFAVTAALCLVVSEAVGSDDELKQARRVLRRLEALDKPPTARMLARTAGPLLASANPLVRQAALSYLHESQIDCTGVRPLVLHILGADANPETRRLAYKLVTTHPDFASEAFPDSATIHDTLRKARPGSPSYEVGFALLAAHLGRGNDLHPLVQEALASNDSKLLALGLRFIPKEHGTIEGDEGDATIDRSYLTPTLAEAIDRTIAPGDAVPDDLREHAVFFIRDRYLPALDADARSLLLKRLQSLAIRETNESTLRRLAQIFHRYSPTSLMLPRILARLLDSQERVNRYFALELIAELDGFSWPVSLALARLERSGSQEEKARATALRERLNSIELPAMNVANRERELERTRTASVELRFRAATQLAFLAADVPTVQARLIAMLGANEASSRADSYANLSPVQRALALREESDLVQAIAAAIMLNHRAPPALQQAVLEAIRDGRVDPAALPLDCVRTLANLSKG